MWENAYLSIKNPKASKSFLDPGRKLLASLRRQLSASAPGAPPLTKSWIRTWIVADKNNLKKANFTVVMTLPTANRYFTLITVE